MELAQEDARDDQTTLPRPDTAKAKPPGCRSGDMLRKASVAIGCVALFLVFSLLNAPFTSRRTSSTSCCNPRSTR